MNDNPFPIQIKKSILANLVGYGVNMAVLLIFFFIGFLFVAGITKDFGAVLMSFSLIFLIVLLVSLLLVGLTILISYLYLTSLTYFLDKEKLILKGGIISKFERYIPYSKIQHIIISRSLMQRFFGISTLSIMTAREPGMAYAQGYQNSAATAGLFGNVIPGILASDAEKLKASILSEIMKKIKSKDI